MLYCNLQVLQCTEIAVQKDFAPQNMTSGGTSGREEGGLKKVYRVAIARHTYGLLINCCNSTAVQTS